MSKQVKDGRDTDGYEDGDIINVAGIKYLCDTYGSFTFVGFTSKRSTLLKQYIPFYLRKAKGAWISGGIQRSNLRALVLAVIKRNLPETRKQCKVSYARWNHVEKSLTALEDFLDEVKNHDK